jgi:CubicO group peptidase (beta-lactamase class C family)
MTMTLVNRRLALSGLLSAIAVIAHASPPSGTAVKPVASPSVQDIQQSLRFVPNRMARYHIRGLSLACIHNGTVAWTQAFGVASVAR